MEKDIYKMKLHDIMVLTTTPPFISVLKVSKGWVYIITTTTNGSPATSVFVPKNESREMLNEEY